MKQIVVMPKSKFLKLQCRKCKNEQIIFNKAATVVKCLNCQEILVEPRAGESIIHGKLIQTLT